VRQMAIKPILFNTEMVRAILDGRKTMSGLSDSTLTMQGFLMIWILLESMLQKIIHKLKL
jgi:hypothetical protein